MDESVNLRVKYKTGHQVISQLPLSLTVRELKEKLCALTDVGVDRMKVLHGYPPQSLCTSDGDVCLSALKLRSGDSLIVEEDLTAVKEVIENGRKSEQSSTKLAEPSLADYERLQGSAIAEGTIQGILTRKCVPPNNSCLFTAIDFVMNDGQHINLDAAKPMRRLVARLVSANPIKFNEGFLGQANSAYCAWILDDKNWGGAIEVSILAEHYQTEINVVDAQTGRIDRFGEGEVYPSQVFLFYDGTHYDPLAYESIDGSSVLRTKFSHCDCDVVAQAKEIGAEAKASRQFTDLGAGIMQCSQCKVYVSGEKEMMKHSIETRHTQYSEVH